MRLFLLIIAVLSLAMMFSFAEAGTQTVGTVAVSPSPIDLTAGSTKTVSCSATVADAIDWNNIATVNATFWDAVYSSETAADDSSVHYANTSCSIGTNTSLTEAPATCTFGLQYYANASTWTCKINSFDASVNSASNLTNATVNSLAALDVTEATIDFGTLALGATSSSDVTATVQNTGNTQIDVQLSGNAMSCTSGSLAQENIHYSASSGVAYGSMTTLTGTAITLDLNVAKSTGSASTSLSYWKISLPSSGVGGTCTNTITFSGVAG